MLALVVLLAAQTPSPPPSFANLELTLTRHTRERWTGDLDAIKKRGVLRVLTRNNASAYFVYRGEERGFQFELAKAFAQKLGVRVQVVVPPSRGELIQALLEGEGDLIAAGMTVTPERARQVAFVHPAFGAPRVLATHARIVKPLERPEDAAAFLIHVSFDSTTIEDARSLESKIGVPLLLADAGGETEMEEMLERVGRGEYEATIVDRHLLQLAQRGGLEVVERLQLTEPLEHSWAVHPQAQELRAAADAFLMRSAKDGLMRILYNRYFEPVAERAAVRLDRAQRADAEGDLSPFDALFKEAGKEHGIDWRLLAALAHTESRFDPDVESPFGAVGLMQVLPSTGKEMGFKEVKTPRNNVRAGTKYLKRLMLLYAGDGVDERQQIRFAIASYNAGPGHVRDARELARLTGRDPNRWFGEVEEAMRLKKDRRWHEKTKLGYARADETIDYVSRVQSRYDVYARHVDL